MSYQKAKKYLVAVAFSLVLVILSGLAGSSIVTAGDSGYQSSYNQGKYGEFQRMSVVYRPPRLHHYGYYGPYGYYHPWGYYGHHRHHHHWRYYGPDGYYHRWRW
jgi:hypothetical protein